MTDRRGSGALDPRRIAAIDVGSNGIRIVIARLEEDGTLNKLLSERLSVRLGGDAFASGELSKSTIDAALGAFAYFKLLLESHGVSHVRAVATSAARESVNADELMERISENTGIQVEIIDGLAEAQLIYDAVARQVDLRGRTALSVDMGGGSVEVTVAINGRTVGCETLRLGPVRLMRQLEAQGLTEHDTSMLLERYAGAVDGLIQAELDGKPPDICVGTGGNIERMGKLRTQMLGKGKPWKIKLGDLESLIPRLAAMPVEERIRELGLRPDRADLIGIAVQVMHAILDEASIERVIIPGVGLKDGLLLNLVREIERGGGPRRYASPLLAAARGG